MTISYPRTESGNNLAELHPHVAAVMDETSLLRIGEAAEIAPKVGEVSFATVIACRRLQRLRDYRAALREWFALTRIGGHLVVTVPHAFLDERQTELPSRWDRNQRRLYTPATLIEEVEEALEPNSYRVRYLGDDDRGYDYAIDREARAQGAAEVVMVIERIRPPTWGLRNTLDTARIRGDTPGYAFEPPRTRVEVATPRPRERILLLKLDHFGDFIMGLDALRRCRTRFGDAILTLVVGTWNAATARDLGLADEVLAFDAFPRNSSEEEPNVSATIGRFREAVPDHYDLAIDLRTDTDTRVLLREVDAAIKAGIGTRGQFPFLDIFLPLDFNRNEPERAREDVLDHHRFARDGIDRRGIFRDAFAGEEVRRGSAIIWGPYIRLRAGQYLFEPFVEIDANRSGLLRLDVCLDTQPIAEQYITSGNGLQIPFSVPIAEAQFEFRIWSVDGQDIPDFSFFGGRLIRQGGASVLHQSEYVALLVELVAMRVARSGVLVDVALR